MTLTKMTVYRVRIERGPYSVYRVRIFGMQRIVLSSTSPIKAYTTRNNAQECYKKISASSWGDSSPFFSHSYQSISKFKVTETEIFMNVHLIWSILKKIN